MLAAFLLSFGAIQIGFLGTWFHAADDEQPDESRTPLHRISEQQFTGPNAVDEATTAIITLCKRRVLLEARDEAGWTPLHCAASAANEPVMRALLNRGANPNAADAQGQTVLWRLVEKQENRTLIPILIRYGAKLQIPDASGRNPIHRAAETCDLGLLEILLLDSAPPEVRDPAGLTPLHLALERQACPQTIDLLLNHGADINATDHKGRSPLMRALDVPGWPVEWLKISRNEITRNGALMAGNWAVRTNFVESLCRRGLRVRQADKRGRTLLHLAALQGQAPLVELLLRHGADPDAQDVAGDTPLHGAIRETFIGSHQAVIDLLMASSTNHSIANRRGETPLRLVIKAQACSEDLAGRFLPPNTIHEFILDAMNGDTNGMAKALRIEPALVNLARWSDFTPLRVVVDYQSVEGARFLLDHGAEVNGRAEADTAEFWRRFVRQDNLVRRACAATDTPLPGGHDWAFNETMKLASPWGGNDMLSPLASAVHRGYRDIALLLVERGASVDLCSAAWLGDVNRARQFLNANPYQLTNRFFREEETLLHLATRGRQLDMMRFCLERRIDPLILNGQGHTAYFIAMTETQHLAAALLEQYGAAKDPVTLASLGRVKELASLVESDHSLILKTNALGQTPLIAAVTLAQFSASEWLLNHGAAVDAQNSSGASALHMACRIRRPDFLKLLLAHDSRVDLADARGCTPLHLAVLEGNPEMARVLLAAGANPNAAIRETTPGLQPFEGETPLHMAALQCSTNLMQALITAGAGVNATNHDGFTPLDLLRSDRSITPGRVRYPGTGIRYQAAGYVNTDAATRDPILLDGSKNFLLKHGATTNGPAAILLPP